MLKLYKKIDGSFRYWEAWEDARQITIDRGLVGDEGEKRTLDLAAGENADTRINREARQPRDEGYRGISQSKHTRLIIQYPIQGMGTSQDLDKRIVIEDLMNERLGWTGLGHCDGGDIGSGTINIFCFVVEPIKALEVTLQSLRTNKALEHAIITMDTSSGSKVFWPEDFQGRFAI